MIEDWICRENRLLGDKAKMELVNGDNVMVCRFLFEEEMKLAPHKHVHEQITVVLEGEMRIMYSGVDRVMKEGDACVIPSDVEHTAHITKVPFRSMDIFSPIREDFLAAPAE